LAHLDPAADYPPPRRAWYAVAILATAYIFSFIDRQILSLLVIAIRRDLHISDTQMSLLMGLSFALFYTILGFPIGRLADTRNRRNIIATGVTAWSLFTVGCGFTSSFFQMFLMRMGVGVGEAALSPPAYSLLSDYFPPGRRALALSVYGGGMYIGAGMAMILGGIIVPYTSAGGVVTIPLTGISVFPWQYLFFLAGLPGLLVGALVLTVREPLRRETKSSAGLPIAAVAAYISQHRATFTYHHLATAMIAFASYACSAWVATFLVRTHGWTIGRAGLVYGTIIAVFATLGILAGGFVCDRLTRRGYRDAHFRVGLTVSLLLVPLSVAFPLVPSAWMVVLLLIPFSVLVSSMLGVAPAALQQIVPNEMRAQVGAMYLFVVNLLGLGAGPTSVALLTDHLFHSDQMLRYSLLIVATTAHLLAALLWYLGRKPYCRTLEHSDSRSRIHTLAGA